MNKFILTLLLILTSQTLSALPIDWSGSFYLDSTRINNYKRTSDCLGTSTNVGSQEIGCVSGQNNANFGSYIFLLNPEIIVNDSVSVKAELSSGYARGGFLGDDDSYANTLHSGNYFLSNPSGSDALNINQVYAEIYSEIALIKAGRFARHFGLGAMVNSGDKIGDRFLSIYDGLQAQFKFNKFSFVPYLATIGTGTKVLKDQDIRELGLEVQYVDKEKELSGGLLYAKRNGEAGSGLGSFKAKLLDLYIKKNWNKFSLGAELPFVSGSNAGVKLNSYAFIAESLYKFTERFHLGLNLGQVKGDDTTTTKNEALTLHSNYKIANILFHYNYANMSSNTNVFDSGVNNANFVNLQAQFLTGSWTWKTALIMARANQAYSGQGKNLGTEVDLGFNYLMYPGVNLSFDFGYLMAGNYYAYTGTATELKLKNPMLGKLGISVKF